jgi:hypothetical protein
MNRSDWQALANRLGYSNELEMFQDLYELQELSVADIGRRLDYTGAAIARRLELLNIERRSRGGANNQRSQKLKLWRVDQRVLWCYGRSVVAQALRVSSSTLQNYLAGCKEV